MTDDQIRSRLREALPGKRLSELDDASKWYDDWADAIVNELLPVVRDLLSAETQQIREERDRETQRANENVAVYDDLKRRFDSGTTGLLAGVELIRSLQAQKAQAEAEALALREALEKVSTLALQATNGWACYATRKIEHDEIARLHKGINAARLIPASPRTGEK